MLAKNEKIGTSIVDFYIFQTLYVLSLKRIHWFYKQSSKIQREREILKTGPSSKGEYPMKKAIIYLLYSFFVLFPLYRI